MIHVAILIENKNCVDIDCQLIKYFETSDMARRWMRKLLRECVDDVTSFNEFGNYNAELVMKVDGYELNEIMRTIKIVDCDKFDEDDELNPTDDVLGALCG